MKKIEWSGYWFLKTDLNELLKMFEPGKVVNSGAFHFANAYTMVCAAKDTKLSALLAGEELISDGSPISYILKVIAKKDVQVRGPDFMLAALRHSNPGLRHYFLGSTKEILTALIDQALIENPSLHISGFHSPGRVEFVEDEIENWVNKVRSSQADIVWVGLGTPKQDLAVSLLAKSLPANFIAVGAAFDFIAGSKKRAPELLRNLSLEWLYRFYQEPKRLWRRYLVGNSYFIAKFAIPSVKSIFRKQVIEF